MLRSITQWSLKSRYVVVVLAAALMVFGIARLRNMPLDVLPEFSPPYVEIQTEALGLSAEEVEQLITLGMEQDLLNGVPWLDTIHSESLPGLSSIVLIFKPGTDLMQARQMVAERLTQAYALPHVSKPPMMLQPLSSTSRVMIVGLSSKSLSPIQVSVLARWTIMPRLKGIPGVANVAIWGQKDRQLQVRVDPKRLQAHQVSLLKVLETAGNALWVSSLSFVEASTPGSGGFIDTANQRLGIRHILPIISPEGLAQVPIEGSTLSLGEVADVVEDHQPLIGDALTKDGASLLMVVEKFPGANTLEVTRQVEEAFSELLPGLPGMEIDSNIFRPADFIEMVRHNLGRAVLIGLLLAALILTAFFLDWRTTSICLVAIPLSLLAAGLVLDATGATLNIIVVTGFLIAIGVVVFDAINSVDNVLRRLRQSQKEGKIRPRAHIILEASLEARRGIAYATLILLLAVSPVFFAEGLSGSFFQPLALSYALAVLASMLVASTITPALSLVLLVNARVERRRSPVAGWVQRVYEQSLQRMIPLGRLGFAVVTGLALLGLGLVPFLNRSVVPSFKERNLIVHLSCRPGTSQPEMTRISGRISDELRSIPGIREVGAHIGRAVLGDQTVDVHSAELWVSIDASAQYDQTCAAIQGVVDGYPGVNHTVRTYLRVKSEDVVARPEDGVVVRVYGETEEGLRERAQEVTKAVGGIHGIVETKIKYPVQQATLQAEVDLAAAQRYGLKPGDVRRAVAILLAGVHVGNLYEEQKVFEVVVWSTPETRQSLSSVVDLMIDTPNGGQVRLGDVATVRIGPTSTVIRHDAVKRYIDIIADVQGRGLGAVAADIRQKLQQLQFPLEYHAEVLGGYAMQEAVRSRLLTTAIAAAIGVFFLLQAAFGSWRLAALFFLIVPAALAGGMLATLATGGVLSFGSFAGLLAVFGITTCNVVSLINHYQRLEREEGEAFGPWLVLRGARERLMSVLMTTLVAGAVLVPALLSRDLPGLEVLRPMAVVILGGLLTSGLLTLLFLPALFFRLGVSCARETDSVTADAQQGVLGSLPKASGMAGA